MCLAPFQSETSSPLATASPPLALISLTTCCAGPTSLPLPARSPPRSLTTTLAPCSASIRQCSRPTPRAPPVTIATRPSHNLAIAPSSSNHLTLKSGPLDRVSKGGLHHVRCH